MSNRQGNIIEYIHMLPWDIDHQLLKLFYVRLRFKKWYRRWGQATQRIVSACPSCKININDAIKATRTDLEAIDITELVAEAGIHQV
ncbi:hypothetical protein ACFLTQ_00230 [Chloroflexota bacterium]